MLTYLNILSLVSLFLFSILLIFLIILVKDNQIESYVINISNYNYPKPEPENSELYTIAVIGTNDIHGSAFPTEAKDYLNNKTYSYGGLTYMASEIKTLLKDWKERILILDAGDQFQGGLESSISNGRIITEFYNYLNYEASTIGNHEFDYGSEFLRNKIEGSSFPYISANIYNNKSQDITHIWSNTNKSMLFKLGKVNIGVIGLSTIETNKTTAGNLNDIVFTSYKEAIETESLTLKEKGANAVLLLSHVGMHCEYKDKYVLKIRMKSDITNAVCDEDDEMIDLLNIIDKNVINGVIGGHKHHINNLWVNNIPFMSSNNLGRYFNVMYLTFNISSINNPQKNLRSEEDSIPLSLNTEISLPSYSKVNINTLNQSYKITLLQQKTKIEGPIPVCGKIFSKNKICELFESYEDQGKLSSFAFHDTIIEKDTALSSLFNKWYIDLEPFKIPFAETEVFLSRSYDGDFILGNFFSDCLRKKTNVDISIINPGGFRTIWTPGDINDYNYFNMFPFNNQVVTTTIKGSELMELIKTVQINKAYLSVSGMKNIIRNKKVVDVLVYNDTNNNGISIDKNKEYTFASIDFLFVNYGDAFSLVKNWWKPSISTIGNYRDILKSCLREKKIIKANTAMEFKRIIFDD